MYSSGTGFSTRHHRNGTNFINLMFNFRTFTIFVCVILIIILFYYYNESQDILSKFEHEKDNCQQKLDSVSAQFQVVYEHKSRLEKSLEQETNNNAKLKQDNEIVLRNAKESAKKEQQKLESRYNDLQQREQDVQSQFKELQLKHSNLKLELDRLEEEKQANKIKADESLKTAENRVTEIERQYSDLAKEVDKLRKENSQLKLTLNDQQKRISEVNQRLPESSLNNLSERNAPTGLPHTADDTSKNSAFTYVSKDAHGFNNNGSSLVDNVVVTVEKIPPFHQVPTDRDTSFNGSQIENSVVNSPLIVQTRAPLPEIKQIQKPFADSHQQQLLENAKFPPAPREDGQPDNGPPVLQHPLGEDQQNLMAKPVKVDSNNQRDTANRAEDDDNVENIGHLPVNVRDGGGGGGGGDDFDVQPVIDSENAKRKDNVLPLPNEDARGDADKIAEIGGRPNKRDKIEAGARVLKEPKEYQAGPVGGGGEKDENEDYRDDEEEKKYKDTEQ